MSRIIQAASIPALLMLGITSALPADIPNMPDYAGMAARDLQARYVLVGDRVVGTDGTEWVQVRSGGTAKLHPHQAKHNETRPSNEAIACHQPGHPLPTEPRRAG